MLVTVEFNPDSNKSGRRHVARHAVRGLVSWLGIAVGAQLGGCASPVPISAPSSITAPVAAQWHAPLPHGGKRIDLRQWWGQFDDPLLLRLIEAAQEVSPTLAQAVARIADARVARVARHAAMLPTLEANAAASRGSTDADFVSTASSLGVQAGWELDLFGASRAAAEAAQARLAAGQGDWHDARVAVAAEVATIYVELRACEAQMKQAALDAASRARTSQITHLAATAGFQSRTVADLAKASAVQGSVTLLEQQLQCELLVKSLTELTALDEATLRRELNPRSGRLPLPVELTISTLPAEVLAQRPDLYAAAAEVVAASADSAHAQAQQWPRIVLTGNIGTSIIDSAGVSVDGSVWRLGPVTVTLPIFDGGVRRANAAAAQTRYATAISVYSARLRAAIREAERALVTLDSTARRSADAERAETLFHRSYRATAASYQAGAASLFELEDARRSSVAAQRAVIELRRERVAAWIALYRALGGGWTNDCVSATPET